MFPVEIKLTATPTARHVEPLVKLRSWLGADAEPGLLVCRVAAPTALPHGAEARPTSAGPDTTCTLLTTWPKDIANVRYPRKIDHLVYHK